MSSSLFTSPVNIVMIITLNYLSGILLISVLFRYVAVAVLYSFIWVKFLYLSILSTPLYVFLCVRKVSLVSCSLEKKAL